jgi:hypothetical protein
VQAHDGNAVLDMPDACTDPGISALEQRMTNTDSVHALTNNMRTFMARASAGVVS